MSGLVSEELGLQKVILGNLPLLGISYQGRRKDEEYKEKFSNRDEMKKVMRVALRCGTTLFAASSHGFNELAPTYLAAVREMQEEEEPEIRLIACIGIPLEFRAERIDEYKRWKTHLDHESNEFGKAVREKALEDPVLCCRLEWKANLEAAKPYKMEQLETGLKVNWKVWEGNVDSFSEYKIAWIEPGSETDFLALSRMDLLKELLDRTHESGYRALLGSHHLGASVPLIEESRVKRFDGYVTPLNKLGVMMFPTQGRAENCVRLARRKGRLIVAIKPFAGGRIEPNEALSYVYKELKVDSCMLGVGSVEEAEEDFHIARAILAS